MKCSRCGSRYPDPSCYVCGSDDDPTKPETPDPEGGSLLKTAMRPDTVRTSCAFTLVSSVVALILLGASQCSDFEPYIAIVILAAMAAFIGSTQDA